MRYALALALLLWAAPAPAVHLTTPPVPVTTCWTDGVWGTYVTRFTRDGEFLGVTGYMVYLDGSFITPLSGGGFVVENGTASVVLHYFAQGLSFVTIVNLYHNLAGGTAHLYYSHDGESHYAPLPIWPVACP